MSDRAGEPKNLHDYWQTAELLVEAVIDIALAELDLEEWITRWHAGEKHAGGWRREDVLGKHLSIFYPREDVADGTPARELAIVRETGRYEERSAVLRRDGSPYVADVVVTRLEGESGGIREFAKVIRDVAKRVAAE